MIINFNRIVKKVFWNHQPSIAIHFSSCTLLAWVQSYFSALWCGFYKPSSEVLVHRVMIASCSCCTFASCTSIMQIPCSATSQKCWIGLRSGDCGGHQSSGTLVRLNSVIPVLLLSSFGETCFWTTTLHSELIKSYVNLFWCSVWTSTRLMLWVADIWLAGHPFVLKSNWPSRSNEVACGSIRR